MGPEEVTQKANEPVSKSFRRQMGFEESHEECEWASERVIREAILLVSESVRRGEGRILS